MKTIIKSLLILVFVAMASFVTIGAGVTFLQYGYMTSAGNKIDQRCVVGTLIYLGTSYVPYRVSKEIGAGTMTLTQAIANSYVTVPVNNMDTSYAHTTGTEKVYGMFQFYGALYAYSTMNVSGIATFSGGLVSASSTLAGHILAKTSGNGHSATYGGSFGVNPGDTLFGGVIDAGVLNATSTVTFLYIPVFTYGSGNVTINTPHDTVGFSVAGLTANSKVTCSYYSNGAFITTANTDTMACVYNKRQGWLTIGGKHGRVVSYTISN